MANEQDAIDDTDDEQGESRTVLPDSIRSLGRRSFIMATGAALAGPILVDQARSALESHQLEIISTSETTELNSLDVAYEFTTTGEISLETSNGTNSAEENDVISQNDDGSWTATGETGNGFGDTYQFNGRVIEFTAEGSYEIRLDGEVITANDLTNRTIEVLTTENPSELDYEFTTTGQITRDRNGQNSAGDNDSITQNSDGTWTADGYTGNGYGDSYFFEGELVDFGPVKDFVEVHVDGTSIDLSQFETEDSGTEVNIGGGEGYSNTVSESEADVVVATLDEFLSAVDSASSGDVIYVAGDATIDASSVTGTGRITIPSGVTLASDRGIDGSPGGHISTDVIDYEHLMALDDDVRLTGLRISGPEDGWREYSTPVSSGVTVEGSNCEIDNVEMWGFNHAAIKLRHAAHIHHSDIHDNPMSGLGYGIQCLADDSTLIEYNRFEFNRHSVANNGEAGYEVRYNYFAGTETPAYQVGTHRPGGTTLKIHHNTFVPTVHMGQHPADPGSHVSIRGVPDDIADIHHNWFYNPLEPSPGRGDESIIQPHVDEFTHLTFDNNQYGSEEPSGDIGCPR